MNQDSVCGNMLPNLLIIGSQHCGTSWIYECLREHPDVFMSPKKETHFFDLLYAKGIDWYAKWFRESNELVVGEATASYLFCRETPKRIARHLPNVKLVASVRNPVDRAYSHYWRHRSLGKITCDFQEAWRQYRYLVERGYYYKHLKRYLEFFPTENLLVLVFDDLESEPVSWIQDVLEFIEVDTSFVPSLINRRVNKAQKHRFLWMVDGWVYCRNFLREKGLDSIVAMIKRTGLGKLIHTYSRFLKNDYPEMKPEARRVWIELFREENQRLSNWLGRDLSHWNEVSER